MQRIARGAAAIAAACLLAAWPAAARDDAAPLASVADVTVWARGLAHPWGLALLADGRALVTEKRGTLRLVARDGSVSEPLAGVPAVHAQGQGGLLDVALDPAFADNALVYLSYAEPGEGGAGTAVARGRLGARALDDVRVIYRQQPKVEGNGHFGSRLVFAPDGALFVTLGDRFHYRDQAQALDSALGKIVRIRPDGGVPPDNPFAQRDGARPEIWSYGHRNVQGAALHPKSARLWTAEHGARGGDEINRPEAGKNYGWPVITYGVDYSGAKIGTGTAAPGMEQPLHYWDPSIAPSGLLFYTGDAFEDWRGDLFVGSLKFGQLVRLQLDGERVVAEHRYEIGDRIRDLAQAADGALLLVTDEADGRILRAAPRAR
ncbi:MAG: hypothetical protein DCC71_19345 [Proteobacteria bacterium]|nr:MAG: hypothetical protein DCC71_19345 [Pseudomonadota bacterium]